MLCWAVANNALTADVLLQLSPIPTACSLRPSCLLRCDSLDLHDQLGLFISQITQRPDWDAVHLPREPLLVRNGKAALSAVSEDQNIVFPLGHAATDVHCSRLQDVAACCGRRLLRQCVQRYVQMAVHMMPRAIFGLAEPHLTAQS